MGVFQDQSFVRYQGQNGLIVFGQLQGGDPPGTLNFGGSTGGQFTVFRTPGPPTSNQQLGNIGGAGVSAAGILSGQRAVIQFLAAEAWNTGIAEGALLAYRVTPVGTTTLAVAGRTFDNSVWRFGPTNTKPTLPAGSIYVEGQVQIATNQGLILVNQVSVAAAGAGTLTNAPTAGNPGAFIPVQLNGVNGGVPWWPV